MTLTLSVPYNEASHTSIKGYKVVGSMLPLSGLFSVEANSKVVLSTTDVRSEIEVGDLIKVVAKH